VLKSAGPPFLTAFSPSQRRDHKTASLFSFFFLPFLAGVERGSAGFADPFFLYGSASLATGTNNVPLLPKLFWHFPRGKRFLLFFLERPFLFRLRAFAFFFSFSFFFTDRE